MLATIARRVAAATMRTPVARTTVASSQALRWGSSWTDKAGSIGSAADDPNVPKDEGHVPTMRDQATGITRAEEVVMDSYGVELFDRDAVFADGDQGTKDEPICILSHAHNRIVGVTYPDDSYVRYFTLYEGYKAFDPESCNYFALRTVPYSEVDAFIRSAEWEEHKDRVVIPGNRPGAGAH